MRAGFLLRVVIASVVAGAAAIPGALVASADDAQSAVAEFRRPREVPFPADNPYTPEKAELGKVLFFDPRLSGSESLACSSCHIASLGWEDGRTRARGEELKPLPRNSLTVMNLAWASVIHWDGRADTLESSALGLFKPNLVTNMPIERAAEVAKGIGWYAERFAQVFPGEGATPTTVVKALATYERTIVSAWSPFDDWVEGKEDAISPSAKRGFALFTGDANCAACHSGWRFTDEGFHDIGVASDDIGRGKVMPQIPGLKHAFKTPGLRNITQRAPYMHDGSLPTLRDAVRHYSEGHHATRPTLSPDMPSIRLSDAQIDDLVAFLETLTGQEPPVAAPALPF